MSRPSWIALWVGVVVLVAATVLMFFVGRRIWGQDFMPNYTASVVGAGLGGALSLIVVMISFTITHQTRRKDLSYARFAFLRRTGERFWQAYLAFCESLGINVGGYSGATRNTTDPRLWPSSTEAAKLHSALIQHVAVMRNFDGSIVPLMDEFDDIAGSVSDTMIFDGEHSLSREITEAWRKFSWASAKVQDYQSRFGWTPGNWPEISKALEQTSESVVKALSSLGELASKVQIK